MNLDNKETLSSLDNARAAKLFFISLDNIKDNPLNIYSQESVEPLKDSIKREGLFNPLCVYMNDNDEYILLSGHTRKKALKEILEENDGSLNIYFDKKYLHEDKIPCFVYDAPEKEEKEKEMLMAANIQRRLTAEETLLLVKEADALWKERVANGTAKGRKREYIATYANLSGKTADKYLKALEEIESSGENNLGTKAYQEARKLDGESKFEKTKKKIENMEKWLTKLTLSAFTDEEKEELINSLSAMIAAGQMID